MNATDELRAALAGAADDLQVLGITLSQLGALAGAAQCGGPRARELLELAQYVADDWANDADAMRERAASIAASVTDAPPTPAKVTVHRTRVRRATARVGGNSHRAGERQS